ncbi:hypothetical protein [Thalassomonas haliotis]|uniref:Uncharacterized protein n=1 Tax=Thalassomonas haliotis TaxID=485448 RepID=A0ABY7V8J5_9GAMM|nr:hypothetical protein [Thalassomonas haliotis]WDE09645.1 hypothetical protein H3N35_15045 [Thalassomonas haliotis]
MIKKERKYQALILQREVLGQVLGIDILPARKRRMLALLSINPSTAK